MTNLTANTTTTQPQGTDKAVETLSWLPDGCPAWCEYGELHVENDQPVDREHSSRALEVLTSLYNTEEPGHPPYMAVHIAQHYRESEARIWVGQDETNVGRFMTLDEARELALQILEQVKRAEGI
jgi:hypothetical protein